MARWSAGRRSALPWARAVSPCRARWAHHPPQGCPVRHLAPPTAPSPRLGSRGTGKPRTHCAARTRAFGCLKFDAIEYFAARRLFIRFAEPGPQLSSDLTPLCAPRESGAALPGAVWIPRSIRRLSLRSRCALAASIHHTRSSANRGNACASALPASPIGSPFSSASARSADRECA